MWLGAWGERAEVVVVGFMMLTSVSGDFVG